MRLIKLFLFLLPSVMVSQGSVKMSPGISVLVCYGRLDPEAIRGYHYVILEAAHYNKAEIAAIRKNNDYVLAYVSLGEVNEHAAHYPIFKENTLGKNKLWNSHYLDLSKDSTSAMLLEMMAAGFEKGFDGFFLDNFDNFSQFGPQKEQKPQLIALMDSIRKQWPNKQFIQNAGLEMLPETAALVNAVIVESVATDYSFEHKICRLRKPDSAFEAYASKLKAIKETYQLPVIVIEYAESQTLKKQVESRLQSFGLDYFIANIDLQTLPKFKP